MSIGNRIFPLALLVVVAGCASHPATQSRDCEIAQRYITASNTSNANLIAPHLEDDVTAVFLAENGKAHSVLEGKEDVLEAVRTYTAQCPSCRSTVRCLHKTTNATYVIEDVVFTDQDGVERHQSAPLIFERDGDSIEAIIYYPSPDAAETEAP